MAQLRVSSRVYFLGSLLKKNVLSDQSKVVVSGSEAAWGGIPPLIPVPSLEDSLDSFVSVLDGSSLNKDRGCLINGYIQDILPLYIAGLARRHPQIYFCSLSPGFTQDSSNEYIQVETNPQTHRFSGLIHAGIAQDFTVVARNFYNAVMGSSEWEYPSGALVAATEGTKGPLCDQSNLEGGTYLNDTAK